MLRLTMLILFFILYLPLAGQVEERQDSIDSITSKNRSIDTIQVLEIRNPGSTLSQNYSFTTISGPTDYRQHIPAAIGSNSASELLTNGKSQVFVKNYGAGSLSSLSAKGLAAEQQEIEWNGMKINSAMNGILDLKLLPTDMVDQVQWHNSADLTAGGKLELRNYVPFALGLESKLNLEMGAFGHRSTHISVSNNAKKFYIRMQLMANASENNFKFQNDALAGHPIQQLEHARTKSSGGHIGGRLKMCCGNKIDFNGWFQQSHREIPRTMLQSESLAEQDDKQWRQVIQWKNSNWTARSGWQWEEINFRDDKINLDAENRANTWNNKLIYDFNSIYNKKTKHFWYLQAQASNTHARAKASNYGENSVTQTQTEFQLVARKFSYNRTDHSLQLKTLLFDGTLYFVPQLTLEKRMRKSFSKRRYLTHQIKFSTGRHLRIPNLNDLYWVPGGNPDLIPEMGWKFDLQYDLQLSKFGTNQPVTHLTINSYYRDINNRILWLPGDAFWSPKPAGKVESIGFDLYLSHTNKLLHSNKNTWAWKVYSSYSYAHSIVKESIVPNDASVGKQLIYTPIHRMTSGITVSKSNWDLDYQHQLTGNYYLTTDNSQTHKGNQTADLNLSYSLIKKYHVKLTLSVYNVWNEQYQVLPWRAMAGRHFRLGLRFSSFHKKETNFKQKNQI